MTWVDNTLAYIDQASFLGLRALGRGPLIQFTWVYDRPVDLDGLRRFHRNLGHGLLGRRVERSPLPFGRHRWVAATGPANLDVAADDRPRDDVWTWADERADLPIDPEYGPQWHLGVQPLIGGGAAVSLVVSPHHRRRAGHLPRGGRRRQRCAPRSRLPAAIVADPQAGPRAGRPPSRPRRPRHGARGGGHRPGGPLATRRAGVVDVLGARAAVTGETRTVVAPCVLALVDIDQWDSRAKALGGNSNSLLAGFAARVGYLLGRTDDAGLVTLSYPVSERVEGDTRGNALTEARMKADPVRVTTDLTELRATMKRQFAALRDKPNELLAPLPLTPLTPRVLVRRLESMIVERGAPIGCSNLGDLDPAVNRPDGTDAAFLAPRIVEPKITTTILDKSGGLLFIGSCRLGGLVSVTVAAWRPGGTNTKDALREVVDQALGDFGLTATVEPEPHRLHKA